MACTMARARFATDLFFAAAGELSSVSRAIRPSASTRSLERRDAGVLVLGLERDVQQLRRVRDPRDRVERGLRVGGVPRELPSAFDVVHAAERRGANGVVRRGLRDGRELLRIVEPVERQRGVRVGVGRRDRDVDQPIGELAPQIRVVLGSREPGEIVDVVDARRRRRAARARRRPLAPAPRSRPVLVVVRDLGDRRGADRRVGVLPSWVGA